MHDEVYIVAGGPSLKSFDFSKLDEKHTIAINRSYEVCKTADILWWSDDKFFKVHEEGIMKHPAKLKCTGLIHPERIKYPKYITTYRFSGKLGFDNENDKIRHGNNSGYAAMCLAIKLGFTRLYLLGYDMAFGSNKDSHWHDGHIDPYGNKKVNVERTLTKQMLPNFDSLLPTIEERGIDVVNMNPNSALKIFRFGNGYGEIK